MTGAALMCDLGHELVLVDLCNIVRGMAVFAVGEFFIAF